MQATNSDDDVDIVLMINSIVDSADDEDEEHGDGQCAGGLCVFSDFGFYMSRDITMVYSRHFLLVYCGLYFCGTLLYYFIL